MIILPLKSKVSPRGPVHSNTLTPCLDMLFSTTVCTDVHMADRHTEAASLPNAARIVFHRQPLTGLVIMRTMRKVRGGQSNTFLAVMLFLFIQHHSGETEEMSRTPPRVSE